MPNPVLNLPGRDGQRGKLACRLQLQRRSHGKEHLAAIEVSAGSVVQSVEEGEHACFGADRDHGLSKREEGAEFCLAEPPTLLTGIQRSDEFRLFEADQAFRRELHDRFCARQPGCPIDRSGGGMKGLATDGFEATQNFALRTSGLLPFAQVESVFHRQPAFG